MIAMCYEHFQRQNGPLVNYFGLTHGSAFVSREEIKVQRGRRYQIEAINLLVNVKVKCS